MNLILIGYRGTGKTTLAQILAQRLGWEWRDSDREIEQRAGKSIAQIFQEDGEPAFRDLEAKAIADLVRRSRTIVATGGGAVIREENRTQLRSAGPVVWLQASPEAINDRLRSDGTTSSRRPRLTDLSALEEIVQGLKHRRTWYQECADLELSTEDVSPEELATVILKQLNLPSA